MGVHLAREPLTEDLWCEVLPLLFAHWKEIAHYQDIELTPDRGRYATMEKAGLLRLFTARTPEGLLVGYACFTVAPSLHYAQSIQAQQDVVYVQPNMRGAIGRDFLRFCTAELAGEGVQVIYHHVKAKHDFGPLLERDGFELVDRIYAKRLDLQAPRPERRERAMRAVGSAG